MSSVRVSSIRLTSKLGVDFTLSVIPIVMCVTRSSLATDGRVKSVYLCVNLNLSIITVIMGMGKVCDISFSVLVTNLSELSVDTFKYML